MESEKHDDGRSCKRIYTGLSKHVRRAGTHPLRHFVQLRGYFVQRTVVWYKTGDRAADEFSGDYGGCPEQSFGRRVVYHQLCRSEDGREARGQRPSFRPRADRVHSSACRIIPCT